MSALKLNVRRCSGSLELCLVYSGLSLWPRVLLLAVVGLHLSFVQGYNTKVIAWDNRLFPCSPSEKSLKEARLMTHKGQNKDMVSFSLWTHAQECQKLIGHLLPLDSQLIKPVQRILKYRLFLEVRTWGTLLSFVLTNSNSKRGDIWHLYRSL